MPSPGGVEPIRAQRREAFGATPLPTCSPLAFNSTRSALGTSTSTPPSCPIPVSGRTYPSGRHTDPVKTADAIRRSVSHRERDGGNQIRNHHARPDSGFRVHLTDFA